MIKIRLVKIGKRNNHFFRVVAIEEKRKTIGKPLDVLGYWHPKKDELVLSKDKLNDWVARGAQVSPTAKKLFEKK